MQTAKWNETEQKPYDIRDRDSIKASNGVPYRDMASLHQIGRYEYIPVALAEGEGLDGVTYSFDGSVIRQSGTVISAAEMAARAQMDRHNQVLAMCDAYGQRVAVLANLLRKIDMAIPCTPEDVEARMIELGDSLPAGLIGDIGSAYERCRDVMTDDDIAAVWSIVGAQA